MHPNPAFRQEPDILNTNLCRQRGFGTLCVSSDPLPLVSHVPFILNEEGTLAEMHLVRSNPIARLVQKQTAAVIVVNGPDGYISPDWYGESDHVPTWNYVAVHLSGKLSPMPIDDMEDHLDRLSAHFEPRLAPKTPWTSDKMSDEVKSRMMRQILPFQFRVETVDGTWKLNQNKTDIARDGAAAAVQQSPIGHENMTLGALMRGGVPEIDKDQSLTYI